MQKIKNIGTRYSAMASILWGAWSKARGSIYNPVMDVFVRDLSISPIGRERHFSILLKQNMSNTLWVKHND